MQKVCAFLLLVLTACVSPGEFTGLDGAADAALRDAGTVSPADLAGATRIVAEHYVVGAARVPTLRFFDRQLGVGCFATQTSQGLRCAPSGMGAYYFIDAACTVRAATSPNDTGCAAEPYIRDTPPGCGGAVRIYAALKQPRQASIYSKSGATCLAIPLATNSDLYALGAEVDPLTLATVSMER